jgi:catechol 2,3-dioxygenase-like lactoylglutathione lyase family enzyme
MELNSVRILVTDFDKSFDFYSGKLGLKVTWGKPGGDYASFDIGLPSGLSIFKSDNMAKALGEEDKPLPLTCRDRSAIVIQVKDLDKTFESLSAKGVDFINKPREMPGWGIKAVHLRDPDGNLLELMSELPREKWDNDLLN